MLDFFLDYSEENQIQKDDSTKVGNSFLHPETLLPESTHCWRKY